MAVALTMDVLVVFVLVAVAIVLFVTELVPSDTTAIAVLVALAVLEPWTHVSTADAISGFASPATVTIVAMYILSGGVEATGAVDKLQDVIVRITQADGQRTLATIVGFTGPLAGFINNTPVVAVFVPLVTDLADQSHVSPSKLLMPLSYAAMLGGTLTLVGTSTNILASDLSATLIDHPFSMFEFTKLGVVVLAVGSVYLLTIGQRLLPERIAPQDLTAEFGLGDHLHRVSVRGDSPLVGRTIAESMAESDYDVDVLQLVRGDEILFAPRTDRQLQARDVLTVRGDPDAAREFAEGERLRRHPASTVDEGDLHGPRGRGTVVECVVPADSSLAGTTIADARLRDRLGVTVLAVRHGEDVVRENLPAIELAAGDGLLVHTTYDALGLLDESGDVFVAEHAKDGDGGEVSDAFDPRQATMAIGIIVAVVGLAALGIVPIVIAALGGVVAMIVADVLRPSEAYNAVNWEVIFLLAGVIPLGLAMRETGGTDLLATVVLQWTEAFPTILILGAFYLLAGLLANVITPVATVALMLPVAVDAAGRVGANQFAFVLAVTFAASTAFMTPMGYQTNLMVYSPGGYRFTDYIRVGGPLQLLLTVVTTLGIAFFWGLQP